jgi:hypothetical protein
MYACFIQKCPLISFLRGVLSEFALHLGGADARVGLPEATPLLAAYACAFVIKSCKSLRAHWMSRFMGSTVPLPG